MCWDTKPVITPGGRLDNQPQSLQGITRGRWRSNAPPLPDSANHIGPSGAIVGVVHAASRLTGLPELTGVRKLWFSDWYDGPITGIAAHGDREYWFVMVTDDDEGGFWDFDPRVYILHRISLEQLAQAWDAHRGFAAAGLPGCLHSPLCATTGVTNNDMLAALRDRWPPEDEDDYMNAPAVGWFRDT